LIVVDTSVLVDFLRGRETGPVERFVEIEKRSVPYAIPGVCCQELLQGARDEKEWKKLSKYLETQIVLHSREPWRTHFGAARIFFDCRRKGITIRGPLDCFIAQLVLETGGDLLHDDDDFEKIARVRPLRTIR
jgi:predicted nucleic acid-binding protein